MSGRAGPASSSNSDPFTDHALRPTTSNATSLPGAPLRGQSSQASLRSGAGSAASQRSRQTRDLFAPSLTRRAPSRALNRQANQVLADSDSDRDILPSSSGQRQPRLRRVRKLSPEPKHSKSKQEPQEELEFVNRQADGSFLLVPPGQMEALKEHMMAPKLQEEEKIKTVDEEYVAVARQFFTSGASIKNGRNRSQEHEFDEFQVPMMMHLKAQVLEKLDDERWRFESTDT